ncbi:CotH kinase family protein [Flavobacterium selenitireducens]|uniref:CotH kinase family protein n=1 Tax=Flavobacterium selenitireducens TaxID=2722704 RepID=UPI00168C0785|nr:T9SS type A sorting domain-containing protein [Flavobacterium selenitireducens]
MKKTTLLGCVIFFAILTERAHSQDVVINEFLASNSSVNTDEDGDYSDWVELYNNSPVPVSLEGYGLSDNASNPYKWIFPSVAIAPGAHLLIWCSDKNRTVPGQPLHANWKIGAEGETLTLTKADGTLSDQIPPIALQSNISYGRSFSGDVNFSVFTQPTPGVENSSNASTEPPLPPQLSVASGIYADAFDLAISHSDPGVTILYTLDGSEPQAANIGGRTYLYKTSYREFSTSADGELMEGNLETLVYENAINVHDRSGEPNDISAISTTYFENPWHIPNFPVAKSTTVRACAFKNGLTSSVVTHNYFVGFTQNSTLPIVSISADEDALFDYYEGNHVAGELFDQWRDANPDNDAAYFANSNYSQSGEAWEIKANLSLWDNGAQVLNQDIGMRINGGYTRNFPNKSLRLYARSEYGNGNFTYPIFGNDYGYSQFKRLVLRNAGNDAYGAYLRDAFMQRSIRHLNVAHQPYRPAITFINGEYWGILDFRERYDDKYFERVFGIESDDLDFLEYNGFLVQEGDFLHYAGLLDYLTANSLSSDVNFEHVETLMDIENYTDMYIANIYAANTDWPHNNIEFYRKRTSSYEPDAPYGQDGRWRWVLKDMDWGFNGNGVEMSGHNTLAFATSTGGDVISNPEWSTLIMRKLLENNSYKNYFINRFADLINTTYQPPRLIGIVDEMKAAIAPEIERHGQRWASISPASWESNIDQIKFFANQRPANQRAHITQKFGIEEQIDVILDVDDIQKGFVKINTIAIQGSTAGVAEQPYPWSGVYFKGIPVTIKAFANPGYEFSHWSGASNSPNDEITIDPTSAISLVAHFNAINNEPEIPISFWLANTSLPFMPLSQINSTFEIEHEGVLKFQSCFDGYPLYVGHENWRKGSLEKSNSQTDVNYLPEANGNIPFEDITNMRGVMAKSPFRSGDRESILVFEQSTLGFQDIKGRIAVKTEGSAPSHLIVDYSVSEGEPQWTTDYLPQSVHALTSDYQLLELDFTTIPLSNDNPNFKMRIRFDGPTVSADNNSRVIFNNLSVNGRAMLNTTSPAMSALQIYPNPTSSILYIDHDFSVLGYRLFTTDGRLIKKGDVMQKQLDLSGVAQGLYLLQLSSGKDSETFKIVRK